MTPTDETRMLLLRLQSWLHHLPDCHSHMGAGPGDCGGGCTCPAGPALAAVEARIEALERALREIARGSFSRNPLTDDSNTIGVMRSFAEAALRGEEER